MDRAIVYTGELPQTQDILNSNKFAMFGLGYGMQMVLGTNTAVDGLACLATSPTPDLHVNIQVGSIYSLVAVDASAYGDLGTDATFLVKQGINPAIQVLTITPPGTVGQSQVYLVQAEYQDVDTGAAVDSYYNSSNPLSPFSGPANAGTSNFNIRQGKCTISLKAGVAATTGTQVTPAPDAGFTGLFAVTVANGQTQINSNNIVQLTTAPIVGAANKLPAIPASVQSGQWLYGVDTSIGGNVVTTATTSTSSAILTFAGGVPGFMANGLKIYDQTTPGAITGGQTVTSFTGTTVTMSGNANATVGSGDTIVFSNDLFAANLTPVPGSLTTGMCIRVKLNSGNVGGATFNANGLGAVAIHRANGSALSSGDLLAGMVVELVYDGAFWQIANYLGLTTGATSNTFNNVNLPYALDTSTSSNTIATSPAPAMPGTISAGQVLLVKLANPITGATTIAITGVTGSPFPVVSFTGQPLTYGSGRAGEMLWLLFDGTNFQIINPPQPLQSALTIFVNPSTGSDSLDGSQATVSGTKGPLQHAQTAVNKAFGYAPSQFSVTVQCADGTYSESILTPSTPGPSVIINGNVGSPSNVNVVGASNSHVFNVVGPNSLTVQNLKATVTAGAGTNLPCCFVATGSGASLSTANTVSGFATWAIHQAQNGASVSIGSHTYSGNSTYALSGYASGTISLSQSAAFTVSTPITVTAWASATSGGSIQNPFINFPSFVNPGNVTGAKFSGALNGVINTQGQGVNYFPGTTVPTLPLPSGAQYG